MRYWLKMIGMTESPLTGTYEKPYADFAKNKRPRHIHPGDHLVLYACGGSKRVFALAEVTSDVYVGGHMERFPYRVDIEYIEDIRALWTTQFDAKRVD